MLLDFIIISPYTIVSIKLLQRLGKRVFMAVTFKCTMKLFFMLRKFLYNMLAVSVLNIALLPWERGGDSHMKGAGYLSKILLWYQKKTLKSSDNLNAGLTYEYFQNETSFASTMP